MALNRQQKETIVASFIQIDQIVNVLPETKNKKVFGSRIAKDYGIKTNVCFTPGQDLYMPTVFGNDLVNITGVDSISQLLQKIVYILTNTILL